MSTVECPHCEHENEIDHFEPSRNNMFDWECSNCEEEFEVEVEYDPTFYASKIEYDDCQECGKNTRDAYKRGRIFPYPKFVKHDIMCQTCWHKAYLEELDRKS